MSDWQELAKDLWPEATVRGDGRFAIVRSCDGTVELHRTRQQASAAMERDGGCSYTQQHELVVLRGRGS